MDKVGTVMLSGNVRKNLSLPDDFDKCSVGDIVIHHGWTHVVIDAGEEQGKRIAAFRSPFTWNVERKPARPD